MNVLVIEDEKIHLEDILITLEELGHTCIAYTDDPMEALTLVEDHRPDVVLQDIQLNSKISGIQLANKIKQLYGVPVIFITSFKDSATINNALDVKPLAYLTKPVQSGDLHAALILAERTLAIAAQEKQVSELGTHYDDFIFVRVGNKQVRISFGDMMFAQTDAKNYCSIVTADGKKYAVRSTIQHLLEIFPTSFFLQTHRAYLVNIRYVDSYNEAEQCMVVKKFDIPVGRTFKELIASRFRVI